MDANNEKIAQRFDELIARSEKLLSRSGDRTDQETEDVYKWIANVQHLLEMTFGEDGEHYKVMQKANEHNEHNLEKSSYGKSLFPLVVPMQGILKAAKEDYEADYGTPNNRRGAKKQ